MEYITFSCHNCQSRNYYHAWAEDPQGLQQHCSSGYSSKFYMSRTYIVLQHKIYTMILVAKEWRLNHPCDKLLTCKDASFITKFPGFHFLSVGFIFFFFSTNFSQGGGWCRNVEECKRRTTNFRGSSKYMKEISFSGILGNKQNLNPGIAFNNYLLFWIIYQWPIM